MIMSFNELNLKLTTIYIYEKIKLTRTKRQTGSTYN